MEERRGGMGSIDTHTRTAKYRIYEHMLCHECPTWKIKDGR